VSMDFSEVCTAGAGASGISVQGLPPLPDPDALDTHARALSAAGADIHAGVNDAARSWAGLAGAYEAPEAGQVLAGFSPVFARSRDLENTTWEAAAALRAYADRARELKHRINALRAEIQALDGLIGGNDDWQSKLNIVDQHRDTMDKTSALAQAILDSDAACATELAALTGGASYSAPVIPRATLNSSTDMLANALTHAQHFYGTDEKLPELPWGPPNMSVRLGRAGSAGQGFVGALIGAGQGLHTLLGTTDEVKQIQAWQSMFALGAAAFTTKNVIDRGAKDMSAEDAQAVMTVGGALKESTHFEDWGTDPWHAAGATTFDVGSMFIGGTGAGLKAGTLGSRLTATGEEAVTLSKAATGLTGAARTALGETSTAIAAQLAKARVAIWDNGVNTALDKLDNGLAKLNQTLNGPQPAYAGIPDQLPTPVPETPWLAKVDQTGAAGAKAQPAPEPAPSVVDQTLGNPSLPGRHPDLQPTIGDTDGGPGVWGEPLGRNDKGVADQISGTGVTATGHKGLLLEYFVDFIKADGSVGKVEFDGHLWRGHPPTEVYQEIKGNYDLVLRGVFDNHYYRDKAPAMAIQKWVDETIRRQVQALEANAPGSRLEWTFTHNPELAEMMEDAVDMFLRRNMGTTIEIVVKYVPMNHQP
jgi:hypothetical protein